VYVCLSVICVSVGHAATTMSCATTTEPIEMPCATDIEPRIHRVR